MGKWLEVAVACTRENVEAAANVMNEMGSGGVVIDDPALIVNCINQGSIETVAPSFGQTAGSGVVVKGYYPAWPGTNSRLEQLLARLGQLGVTWSTREVHEEDWATAWREYYKPIKVGKRFVIKPSWEEYNPGGDEIIIELDPGMAFGCGTHETTSMCLALLEDELHGGELVYDVGTGSGILSVAAALLGAEKVVAVDIDEVAVRTAAENIQLNNVVDIVTVRQGNLLEGSVKVRADIIVANIIADVIKALAPDASAALKTGGNLIASGIIRDRADEVALALENAGLTCERRMEKGEWVALVCRKV
ncbi:ribosomal protein L11 methyltransferase [Desulfotomaculum arcticum]|uniref:Ribosomal protein L11 methyltransferase n=1 Tax=Desulfotruncus arcticus DSM 17038 TaxID=1121424 RepID=A0A1I2XH99_9FIRM|nr:50S ribosomal protein L11 methyltransferase [Desulfotruncus arcticus]SFH12805.1 ribosomal protein L11 methyltransferase [Desulfotomaculum arcticum] [Desulfotruncus arcticus DSM 17038]